jgi:hypothetical protein
MQAHDGVTALSAVDLLDRNFCATCDDAVTWTFA